MHMERTQIVSMRLDKELLQKIEKIIEDRPYWSRTLLVNRLLTALFNETSKKVVPFLMWNYFPERDNLYMTAQILERKK